MTDTSGALSIQLNEHPTINNDRVNMLNLKIHKQFPKHVILRSVLRDEESLRDRRGRFFAALTLAPVGHLPRTQVPGSAGGMTPVR